MTGGAGPAREALAPPRARATLAALVLGYIGVYLCRKNLSVAIPLLQETFGASKGEVGRVASVGTAAYAIGKLALSPLVDRVGGRAAFAVSLLGVALLGGLGAAMPSLGLLTIAYGANRTAGAAAWPAMMKLVPTWFRQGQGKVVALLSLSYVVGGVAAMLFAREVVARGGGWRAVMGTPSLVLVPIAVACAVVVRAGPHAGDRRTRPARTERAAWRTLLVEPQFLIVCALSLSLTLMRESFNTWSVDFLASTQPQQGGARALSAAALRSTTFDLAGGISIVVMGLAYDRTPARTRRWLIAGILAALAVVIAWLPAAVARTPASGPWLIGAVGLLVYGPYSLRAGVLAVEIGGVATAATAAGVIDAVGYLAGILAGEALGRVLDLGGYPLGFRCLAAITAGSALLALGLRPGEPPRRILGATP